MKRLLSTLIVLLIIPGVVFGINEEDFKQEYEEKVIPFFETFKSGSFSGVDDIRINYVKHEADNETGAIVILHGKSESNIKYAELVCDLQELGCSFYLMDHRGMGFSGRMIEEDTQRVHVENFYDYVEDVKKFMDTVVNETTHQKVIIIAHSMGGAVAAHYLEQYPDDIDAAVLSSPMLQVDTGSYPELLAFGIAALGTGLGLGKEYALGQGPREAPVFDNNTVTHSFERWSRWEMDLIPNNLEVKSGGPSYQWVANSIFAGWMSQLRAKKVETPVLLFQAGQDSFVVPEGQDVFCDKAADCTKIVFEGAKHEILMETDVIRDKAVAEIKKFLNE